MEIIETMNPNPTLAELGAIVGQALRRARERVHLTPGDLAGMVGIDAAEYGRIERGEELPSMHDCILMAVYLGVSMDELLGLCEPSCPAKNFS